MASNMSSSNSGSIQRVCGQCGSGPCDVRTSRSSTNPGRRYFKCPNNSLAIKEIEPEGRGMTQLSNNSLHNIATKINAMTGEMINLKQCKNRYGVLKLDWHAWILLADSRRGATSLGMNPITGSELTCQTVKSAMPYMFWTNNGIEGSEFICQIVNSAPHYYSRTIM
ncbi:hypothetical protein RHMOL_Rhmol02G0215300 [Rhododendron molle]|uniref:Uncharacterized protein n=1 Tax=Rhododendron molle TaxID=49168 RepID=A0ACC0PU87_RHOML|nr:hypothetical protein RHMOL_Rhmol02G0215300 [Rhododendron molle]